MVEIAHTLCNPSRCLLGYSADLTHHIQAHALLLRMLCRSGLGWAIVSEHAEPTGEIGWLTSLLTIH